MKNAPLVALVVVVTQFTGCSRKSDISQIPPTIEGKATTQTATIGAIATSPTTQEAYRLLKKDDGIEFAILAEWSNVGTPGSHIIQGPFGLMDGGHFIPLDIIDQTFTDEIWTYKFGAIKVKADSSPYAYLATETQIEKIHEFLSKMAKSPDTSRR